MTHQLDLVEMEIRRHDWSAMLCGCGESGGHLPALLLELAAQTGAGAGIDYEGVARHVISPADMFLEPTPPVVAVIMAVLASKTSGYARVAYLEMLLSILSADAQAPLPALEGRDVAAECEAEVRRGLWALCAEVLSSESIDARSHAYEILTLIEEDEERVERLQETAGERLPWDLRS
ncbi:hypothetical protein RGF97_06960 [Streptomyces roseicoloratus]|uniref:Uncharacterized protein n=1 Tax=Streptomyces roseicoloratus TaxID=2508722 RepID=A0ABY9RTU1_9ACTN|nr:hypothetical protein [Streptomyces roseicoloratus]WMX44654.1 hypothetical protein RGF97_06960 [Streptomyces roseicoloratus]